MALVLADRVRETTAVVGTGTATLLGAIASYQSFAAIGNANTVYYTIVDQSTGEWEVGIGTYTASGTTLSRDTVLSSSNAGALVNFPAGTKDVWGDYPAGKAVTTDTLAYPPAIGGTTPNNGTFTEVAVTTGSGNSAFNENDTITGWLYSGNSFSVSAQESVPTGLFIGSAGTKMYVNGTTGDDVNEYTLGTAWNITTATFVTVFSTAAQDSAPNDIFFKPDGLSMFIMGSTNDTVFQYTLGTAWSVATASYASKSFSVASQETSPTGLWFKTDGTVMYVIGSSTDAVYQYALATAWDVSTASYGGVFYSVAAQETTPNQVNLSANGLKMWMLGATGDDIWEYNLGTAWDVSTATPVNNFYVGFQDATPTGLFIDSTAPNRVYIAGNTNDIVYQYNTENNAVKLDTQKLYVGGGLTVNDNFVAGANAYIDGTLNAQGSVNLGSVTTFSITAGGTMSLGTGIGTVTHGFGAGATVSGSTKTLNIGTAGLSGSTTNITLGSAVSGSLGTTTIQAPTVNIGQLATQFSVVNAASAVNFVQVTGAATTKGTVVSSQGSDANISSIFQSKGTGAIDLAAGSSGVNISNGGTVTAITRTAGGIGYTSVPSVAISAPTTAGGVQATATVTRMFNSITPTIQAGGTGYTAGDTLTVVGGTPFATAAIITVSTVSAGVITAVTATALAYSALPTNPVSVTGGTGSGATFNLTWSLDPGGVTITNAGSGYVEQPTVTFSGGGGSGAAAYATVGAGSIIRSLGSTGTQSLSFYTPSGEVLRLRDTGSTGTYVMVNTTTFGANVLAQGATNAFFGFNSNGTSSILFGTNGNTGNTQLQIAHTASAVNYVQVTGAATTGLPQITAQGSDTNPGLLYITKGTGEHRFATAASTTSIQFRVRHINAPANYCAVIGAPVGSFPEFQVLGTDTNIDLTLTPKGTGNVRFGTYTGTILTPTGYVEIKDSGGTIRRLLVG